MGDSQIKILIADDHVLIREGLKKILISAPEISTVDEASDSREVIQSLSKERYDVVVLDISLPGKSGLELLKDIKLQYPKLPVLMLSMHPEDRFAVRALKAGAAGYITKDSAAQDLITAIRKALDGRKHVSPALAEKLAFIMDGETGKAPHENLSDREFQVFCLLASGKTPKQVSSQLYLSLSTVNTYRSRILQKMNMKTDADLIKYALQNHLID